MNEIENVNSLFAPNVEVKEAIKKNADEYSPSADKGQGGVYKAIVRFIPWWQDPTYGSIKEKWVAWLEDPITQRGRTIDCPSSIGKSSILQDMYWKLKKNDNVALQAKAAIFSRRHTYASCIQIIKDQQNPELEGKILIYRYGIKIWEKINAELKPMIGAKHDPFDIINGKAFALVITKVSGYNNYDQSKFIDDKIPLCIPNNEHKLIPINESSDKQQVFDFVKTSSPDLNRYNYKEWDQDTNDYVNHVINAVTGQGTVSQKYAGVKNNTPTPDIKKEPITSTNLDISDLSGGFSSTNLPDLNIPTITQPDQGIAGNLDDVLKNL